ncbi:MAG: hypothetical protein IPI66_08290 [Chitinophagaceae bacterium]|nr:hypothetical protein [Chitinophagaceae bacterium]MBL0057028.1 hypothetical protein [Chitinophagaceae bacterium]
MQIKASTIAAVLMTAVVFCSCSPRNISGKYYLQHEKILDKIEESYKALYSVKPFTLCFTDKQFNIVSVEIITDSLKYIYEFQVKEDRLNDTLIRYGLNASKIQLLIDRMRSIRCTWISNFDYYVEERKNSLIFMSVKPVALKTPFSAKKYYILTYFSRPQKFDAEGRLLDRRELRKLQKINGEIFWRINDKVCYTISGDYR